LRDDSRSGKGLDLDLISRSESEDEVKGGFLHDVVVSEGSAVFKLPSSKDESLLDQRDSLFRLCRLIQHLE
jgi:hypothetical protein